MRPAAFVLKSLAFSSDIHQQQHNSAASCRQGKESPFTFYHGGYSMAFSINTNIAALNAHRNLSKVDEQRSTTLSRLSTGLRINKAADDASGLSIANAFRAQSLGIGQAIQNGTDATSLIQIADGALEETSNILNTIRTKSVQAASDGQTTETRRLIQNDIDRLLTQLDNIAQSTSFNGQALLSGAFTNKSFQIGANANQTYNLSIGSTESTKIGHVSSANLALSSADGGDVQLTITSSITGQQLTLNSISIEANNQAENGLGALASEINRYTSTTGIRATADVQSTGNTAITAGTTGSSFAINGVTVGAINVLANDSNGALVNGINAKSAETGIVASTTNDGKLTLSSDDGRAIKVTGDLGGVAGANAAQLSTLGTIHLVQSGVSEFQISGIGAGATGVNVTVSADITTVQDSVLASGSTLGAGSQLAAESIVGGDAVVESSVGSTQLDSTIKAGSTLRAGSILSAGTQLTGSLVVAGNIQPTTARTVTALTQDAVLGAGTTLQSLSVLGKGTVVTTQFSSGGVTYTAGSTLSSAVTLDSAVTLSSDLSLKYNSDSSDNSAVSAGSTLTAGSTLGSNLTFGITRNDANASTQSAAGTTTTDRYVTQTISSAASAFTIKAGSLLKSGSVLALSTATTYEGPTLVHSGGTLRRGDAISTTASFTLSGDQVISADLATSSALGQTLTTGTLLTTGFVASGAAAAGAAAADATLTHSVLASDLTLKSGSTLHGGSTLLAGSELGSSTYVYGGATTLGTARSLTTYQTTQLKAGSFLESSGTATAAGASTNRTVLASGSTVGASTTTTGTVTLTSDQTLKAGSVLGGVDGAGNTLLKAGTVIGQDLVLNTVNTGDAATEITVTAGTVLSSDLYVDGSAGNDSVAAITLSSDLTLKKDSILATGSVLAINTENAGTVGLSDKSLSRLSDINVLTGEGAQLGISIADAALKNIDSTRASLGAVQNQLTSTIANLSVTLTNVNAAESGIRDVDFASEAGNFSRLQVLSQAGSFALSQANASAQSVLSLLQQ